MYINKYRNNQIKNESAYLKLRALYEENININHISEPLVSCAAEENAPDIAARMIQKEFDVIGIEEEGIVIGYVRLGELRHGICRDYLQPFSPTEIISDSTPLLQALFLFKETQRLFIIEGNRVTKVVTLADLQKMPVRMLFFGLISLLEMHLLRIIKEQLSEDEWKNHLNENRVEAARKIFTSRREKNEAIELSDCLQLCDKRDIISKDTSLRNLLQIESKSKFVQDLKLLEALRNNLAHAQDLNTINSWNDIISLLNITEMLLERCEQI